jgi:hypothetical protein
VEPGACPTRRFKRCGRAGQRKPATLGPAAASLAFAAVGG